MKQPGPISQQICAGLSRVLRDARVESGLSLNELSKRVGLNRMAISFIEREQRVPTMETFVRIAAGLGIAPSALLEMAEAKVGKVNWKKLASDLAAQRPE